MSDPANQASPAPLRIQHAVNAWESGAHDKALEHCTHILADNPQDVDALHLAALIYLQHDSALSRELLQRARAVRETPAILVDIAGTYSEPESPQVQELLERALALDPLFPPALNNLANLYAARGDKIRALAIFESLTVANPEFSHGHLNYGRLLLECGSPQRAEKPLRRSLELNPGHLDGWINLATALAAMNRHTEALALLKHALTLCPDSADLLFRTGRQQTILGQYAEAQTSLKRSIELDARNAAAWNCLGNALYALGNIDDAHHAITRAIGLNPDFSAAYCSLGSTFKSMGDIEAAIACYRRALECDPNDQVVGSLLAYMLEFATDDPAIIRAAAQSYSARHEAPLLAQHATHANNRDPERRLRIGYVSPDFRGHCQMLFTAPLFAHHDHRSFEIVCYSTAMHTDNVTEHLAQYADLWRDVRDYDDERLAQRIRDDGIDILVDLTMHMPGARRLVFARKPAPVQVAWLAYPGTTGSAAIDWRLTDPWLDPPSSAVAETQDVLAAYTERSFRLPSTFWCYDAFSPDTKVNALPANTHGYVTFGCLNNPCKLTDTTLDLWSGILIDLSDSRLLILAPVGATRERHIARLEARGVDASRVRFVGMQGRHDYLRAYGEIDIALETLPANGHTTSLDSLWMGVPVPTRAGRAVAGRGGLSLLSNLGLTELIAHSDEDYVRIVTTLARDLPRLAALRASLRRRMEASPLMNGEQFARAMENAYRQMWRVDSIAHHNDKKSL